MCCCLLLGLPMLFLKCVDDLINLVLIIPKLFRKNSIWYQNSQTYSRIIPTSLMYTSIFLTRPVTWPLTNPHVWNTVWIKLLVSHNIAIYTTWYSKLLALCLCFICMYKVILHKLVSYHILYLHMCTLNTYNCYTFLKIYSDRIWTPATFRRITQHENDAFDHLCIRNLILENRPSCHIWYFEKYRF